MFRDQHKAKAYSTIAKAMGKTIDWMVTFAIELDEKRVKLQAISLKLSGKHPTFVQYANRLIEFIDEPYIVAAYNRYVMLVESGLEPSTAFHMVTNL